MGHRSEPKERLGMSQSTPVQATSAASATVAQAQGAAEKSTTPAVNSSTKINSLEELKTKAPKVYNQILQSLAQNMIIDLRHRQERLEKEMKKMQGDR